MLERISTTGDAGLLDDDHALKALEASKAEAREAQAQKEAIEASVDKLRAAADSYNEAAGLVASLYAVLERLPQLHEAYAFSLDEFLDHALFGALAATPGQHWLPLWNIVCNSNSNSNSN